MPKVVPDQYQKFLHDPFFKKLKKGSEIRYKTCGKKGISLLDSCRSRKLHVSLFNCGIILELTFDEFLNEAGLAANQNTSVVLYNQLLQWVEFVTKCIIEGVCVVVSGFLSMSSLEGILKIDFDAETAKKEEEIMKKQIKLYNSMKMQHLLQQQMLPQHNIHHPYSGPDKFDVTEKNKKKMKTVKTRRKTTKIINNDTRVHNTQIENNLPYVSMKQTESHNTTITTHITDGTNTHIGSLHTNNINCGDVNTHTNNTHTNNTHTNSTYKNNTHINSNNAHTNIHCHWKKRLKSLSIST